ncbi:MAG TPA: hypothetical protein VHO01_10555 [Jatrophihabitans sp.]|nr:hypothetical protein [Jatrophihabitans sp.]
MPPLTAGDRGRRAAELLRGGAQRGFSLDPGLAGDELTAVQASYGFTFCPEHAALLRLTLPVGAGWPDWRHGGAALQAQLSAPVDGVLFDVAHNGFWWPGWGPHPGADAAHVARAALERAPRLVPLYGHRYLPAAPAPDPAPVLSVVQTDVVGYGRDLLDYLNREFGLGDPVGSDGRPQAGGEPVPAAGKVAAVPFWSELDRPDAWRGRN